MAIMDGTITDVPEVDLDAAAEQLLKRWTKKPESTPEKEAPKSETPQHEEEDHEEHEEEDHDDEKREDDHEGDEEEEAEKKPRQLAADDHEVAVDVDGKEHRVAVKDLKRLFGQEASLTRKSQEVATLRTQATEQADRHVTALNGMLGRAQERFKPYEGVDWNFAAAKLSSEEYQQLKTAHDTLKSDVDYYKTELDTTIGEFRTKHTERVAEAAKECLAALTNPEHQAHIEGFNETIYNDIRQYATSEGVPQQLIDQTIDPVAIKLIHKAMLYDKAQKTGMKKLSTAPKNVNKTPTNDGNAGPNGSARKAMEKLRASGDPDAAAEALLARWSA